jgi:hypothetical protein
MEEISYLNFFKFISQQRIRIPLVETALIQNEQIDSILTIDEQGYVKKKPSLKINSVHYYLQKLLESHESHNRLHQERSQKVCYFYKKGTRSLINELKVKEILSKRSIINIDLVQPYIRSLSDKDKFLHAKLCYMQSQFIAEIHYGDGKVTDPIITESVLDIATILIHCIENFTFRRVLQIEVEYLEEQPGSIWLVNVPKCTVVEAKYTFKFPILKESDILTLSKSIPKNLGKSKTPKVLNFSSSAGLYTFRRGQLRNIHSNLDSPIRMTPVNHLPCDEGFVEKIEESKNFSKTEDLTCRSETPQQLKEAENSDQLFIKELLKGFFTIRPEQSTGVAERRTSLRGNDTQKRTILRRNNVTIKSFPKLLRRREYDNDFIECVLKTYFKGKDGNPGIPKEFGIASHVSSEEFTHFLNNNCEGNREDFHRLRVDTLAEDNFLKQPKTPDLNYGRKNFGMNLVKGILAKRGKKESVKKLNSKARKSFSKKFFDMYLSSPILKKKEL